jgi:tetratricopeptide (TPR) repeat protein
VLVRDVAYRQIPRVARANKHRAAGEWIESLGRPDDHAELLAHHYSTALELATVAGTRDVNLSARARRALADAGDRASSLNAYAAAAVFYERALAVTAGDEPPRSELLFRRAEALYRTSDERRERALDEARKELLAAGDNETAAVVEALLSDVWWGRGQLEASLEHLAQALELMRDAAPTPAKARVLMQAAQSHLEAQEFSDAITLAEEALVIARAHRMKHIEAEALVHRGNAKYSRGDEEGRRDIECGLALALEAGDLPSAARASFTLSTFEPDIPRALELLSAAEELYQRLGDATGTRQVRASRVNRLGSTGRWDEALELADDLIAECEEVGPHRVEWVLRYWRARMRFARGDSAGALDDLERGIAVERTAGGRALRFNLGVAARLYLELGRLDEARALSREFLAAPPIDPRAWPLDFVLVAGELGFADALERPAKLLAKMPPGRGWTAIKLAVIEGRLVAAADFAATAGTPSYAAELRLAAAERLVRKGRHAEANAQLEQALPFFRSVGAAQYIRQAETLLAASKPAPER